MGIDRVQSQAGRPGVSRRGDNIDIVYFSRGTPVSPFASEVLANEITPARYYNYEEGKANAFRKFIPSRRGSEDPLLLALARFGLHLPSDRISSFARSPRIPLARARRPSSLLSGTCACVERIRTCTGPRCKDIDRSDPASGNITCPRGNLFVR